jgi:lipopolysaccharide/colanic/teichoic acid biosynthesis glycosyltransferase
MLFQTLFLISAGLVVYHHALYPPLLRILARWLRTPVPAGAYPADSDWPSVTIVVPAHNEGRFIAEKIGNLLALDYPRGQLKVIIECDGCTDDTVVKAERASTSAAREGLDITVVDHVLNRGKVAVLNEAIAGCDSDIVVLSDVTAVVERDALKRGASHFQSPEVGVVCATYKLGQDASAAENVYWQYQTSIKADEAAVSAPMGAHGAFYLFRRQLWHPLAADTINDDFILPMAIVACGWRAVYDPTIVATEQESTSTKQDFQRRRRISAGNLQQVLRLPELADPFRPDLAFVFLSGKALRAFVPWLLVIAFISSGLLAIGSQSWAMMFAVECGLGVIAAVGFLLGAERSPRPLALVSYLTQGYLAGLVGTVDYAIARDRSGWKRVNVIDDAGEFAEFIHPVSLAGKRTLDIAVALVGLAVLAVLIVPLSILIKLDSRGPVFYRQLRVGRAGARFTRLFRLAKFRTMRTDAESKSGAVWATARDPRITRIGRFLRKTRLDELPQFVNVLHGDMSIVGPRPERPQFFKGLEAKIPFYIERTFGLKPGITGLAQVSQGYDTSIEDVRSKTLFDHAYAMRIANPLQWLKTDLEIIFRTFTVVILGKGQ